MDVLSDVLRTVRLQGALFLNGEFHEPWCVAAPRAGDFAALLCPGASELAILHLVLEGRCWIRVKGAEPVALRAGEAAVLPRGDAHLIGSGVHHAPVELRHLVHVKLPEVAPLRYGGEGDRTLLVCGWFACERDLPHPLMAGLPPMFRCDVAARAAHAWLEPSLRYALREAAAREAGGSAVTARIAEALFVEALRAYVETLPPEQGGWLAGLRDPQVGRCLALMHEQPSRAWSVEALARELNVSRSVLAERFSELVGMPPMQYLKRWRLATAARLLCSGRSTLLRVAEAVGYESEAAFSRAFKLEYGVTPGRWRSSAPQARNAAADAGLRS